MIHMTDSNLERIPKSITYARNEAIHVGVAYLRLVNHEQLVGEYVWLSRYLHSLNKNMR